LGVHILVDEEGLAGGVGVKYFSEAIIGMFVGLTGDDGVRLVVGCVGDF
jgi:hypothetical protein